MSVRSMSRYRHPNKAIVEQQLYQLSTDTGTERNGTDRTNNNITDPELVVFPTDQMYSFHHTLLLMRHGHIVENFNSLESQMLD